MSERRGGRGSLMSLTIRKRLVAMLSEPTWEKRDQVADALTDELWEMGYRRCDCAAQDEREAS